MIINEDKLVDFLIEYGLNFNQFMLCWILESEKRRKEYNELAKGTIVPTKDVVANIFKFHRYGCGWTKGEIDDLSDKGFILNKNRKGQYQSDHLEVTEKFYNEFFVKRTHFEEFMDEYPTFAYLDNGKEIILKNVSNSKIDLQEQYKRKVLSKQLHEKVMSVLSKAKEKGRINMSVEKFIASEAWTYILDSSSRSTSNTEALG